MRGTIRLIGFIVALLWPILPALAGPMAGLEAQTRFSEWSQEFNGTSIDFNELAPGTLADTLYACKSVRSGVVF